MQVTDEEPASGLSTGCAARSRPSRKPDWHAVGFFVTGFGAMMPVSWALGYLTLAEVDPATEYTASLLFLLAFAVNIALIARRETLKSKTRAPDGTMHLSRRKLALNLGVMALVFVLAGGVVLNKLSYLDSTMREGPTDVRLIPGRPDMEINGTFAFGLTDRVRRFLDEHPQVRTVYLTSRGGVGVEAVALADLIHERNLSTYVPFTCLSACTAAFSAGRERWLKEGARLGYHSGGLRVPMVPGQIASRVFGSSMRNAYLRGGISEAFVERALSTPFGEMWFPNVDELTSANAITGIVDRFRFGVASRKRFAGYFSLGKGYWRMTAVTMSVPGEREVFEGIISSGYDDGMSEGEIGERVFRRAGAIMLHRISKAEDAAVLEAGRLIHAAMSKLGSSDDASCVRLGMHADLGAAGDALTDKDFDGARAVVNLVRRAVDASAPESLHPLPPGPVRIYPFIQRPDTSCGEVMAPYAEALSLPDAEAAVRLREMFRDRLVGS